LNRERRPSLRKPADGMSARIHRSASPTGGRKAGVGRVRVLFLMISVVVLSAGAAAVWLWVRAAIDARWSGLERKVGELHGQTLSRDGSRPVLRGQALDGDAWKDYSVALQSITLPSSQEMANALSLYSAYDPKVAPSRVISAVQAHSAAIDALRLGARRREVRVPREWTAGKSMSRPTGNETTLVEVAVCKARLLASEGKAEEALELLLDVCQFCRDFAYNGDYPYSTLAAMNRALTGMRVLIASGMLPPEQLDQLAHSLEILDLSFPSYGHMVMNEALCWGYSFLSDEDPAKRMVKPHADSESGAIGPGWRCLFSRRLAKARAFETILSVCELQTKLAQGPWDEVTKYLPTPSTNVPRSENDFESEALEHLAFFPQEEVIIRARLAKIRMLRMAARWKVSGEVLDLQDPFGGRLRHQLLPNKLRMWSVDQDGFDHGGFGEWQPTQGKDTVLEVER
jgi:hypothetical protein